MGKTDKLHAGRLAQLAEGHAKGWWQSQVCSAASAVPRGRSGILHVHCFLYSCLCPILAVMSALFCELIKFLLLKECILGP